MTIWTKELINTVQPGFEGYKKWNQIGFTHYQPILERKK